MRKLKVRHDPLPGVGEAFELDAGSGLKVTVVAHRSGRRDVAIGRHGRDEPTATVALTRKEALALAALLSGTHIEITTAPRT
jgi:K+/H+ antiporter YhaU regulatory subunit KhtT